MTSLLQSPRLNRLLQTWFLPGLLMLGLVVLTRPSIRGNDGVQNYAPLRSLLLDRDLDFTNDYGHYVSQHPLWFDGQGVDRDPITDLPVFLYGVGSALLWAPAVLTVHLSLLGLAPELADGFSRPYEQAVGFTTAALASLGLWFLFGLLARRLGRSPALFGVILLWLASPLFFYMYLHPSMSHGAAFFAVMLLLFLLDRPQVAEGQPLWWAALGAAGGLMVLVRIQDAIFLLIPVFAEVLRLNQRLLRRDQSQTRPLNTLLLSLTSRLPAYAAAILAGAAMLMIQAAAWSVLQGSWFSGPRAYREQGGFSFLAPHLFEVWFSAYHGLFHWHPILLCALVGFCFPSRHPAAQAVAWVMFLSASWVIGSWSHWWAGASFGHRMFISALPALGWGLALFYKQFFARRLLLWFLAGIAILWNFSLVVQYGSGMIPRNAPVPIHVLAGNSVTKVPAFLMRKTPKSSVPPKELLDKSSGESPGS